MKVLSKDHFRIFFLLVMWFGFSPATFAQTLKNSTVKSPDGKIVLEVGLDQSKIYYKVSKEGKSILNPSFLGFELKDGSLKDNLSAKILSILRLTKPGNSCGAKRSRYGIITTR